MRPPHTRGVSHVRHVSAFIPACYCECTNPSVGHQINSTVPVTLLPHKPLSYCRRYVAKVLGPFRSSIWQSLTCFYPTAVFYKINYSRSRQCFLLQHQVSKCLQGLTSNPDRRIMTCCFDLVCLSSDKLHLNLKRHAGGRSYHQADWQ